LQAVFGITNKPIVNRLGVYIIKLENGGIFYEIRGILNNVITKIFKWEKINKWAVSVNF
jgi:hypothetical protein